MPLDVLPCDPAFIGRISNVLHQRSDIAQTARALRIAQITSTLTCLDTRVDVVEDFFPFLQSSSANIANHVTEAITDEHAIAFRFLLKNPLSDLVHRKRLLAVFRKIDDRTGLLLEKVIQNILRRPQTYGQNSFDGLPLDGFSL